MAEITAALVKDLREKSGAGMMDCKKALQENGGDVEASMDWLRTKGMAKAAKKADRAAAEGLVAGKISADGKTGALVEFNAETDFVAKNDGFQAAARDFADVALTVDGDDVDAIRNAKTSKGEVVQDTITNLIATIGENMQLRRSAKLSVSEGAVALYLHNAQGDGVARMGVLVAMEGGGDAAKLQDVGKKIAMHVAATAPLALSTDELDPAVVAKEREIQTQTAMESGKPREIAEKMVEGRIRKWQEEVVLLKQPFVMNPDQTIEQLVAETAKETGAPATLKAFVRFALGEGVEKKVDDFAAEVASMTGQPS